MGLDIYWIGLLVLAPAVAVAAGHETILSLVARGTSAAKEEDEEKRKSQEEELEADIPLVDEAAKFLADVPAASRSLETLRDVGLGYLRLGQPATELSGGEAQRIKLATELQRARRGHALYLLDEPTAGLHPADIALLLQQLLLPL